MLLIDRPAEAVLRIRINRPAARNAINGEARVALIEAFTAARQDGDVRALVIGGVDGIFCAGGDLPTMVGLDADAALARLQQGHALVAALWEFPKPVVAAVERFAVGAGAGLALAADDVVMGRTAVLSFPFMRLGLVPDWGLMAGLPKRVGWATASRLFRECGQIKGDEAVALGAADYVVDDSAVMEESVRIATTRAALPPAAFARLKHEMRGDAATMLNLPEEARAQVACLLSSEFTEGYAAFQERRPPRF